MKRLRSLLADRGRLLVGTEGEGVFVSGDAGRTWTGMAAGLPAQAQIFALTAVGETVFSGLYAKGLYSWNEREGRWVKVEGVSPLELASVGGTLVAGNNPGGLFWSEDGGKSWGKGTGEVGGEAPVWELGAGGGRVFAGAGEGIFYSEDGGRKWVPARAGLPRVSPGISFFVRGEVVLAGSIVGR
ncbi:MAG: hypothetical protein NTV52_11030 [Acidobacteria bacterium]|nr:hypothetical protein [Acidobacteriota bacterium]